MKGLIACCLIFAIFINIDTGILVSPMIHVHHFFLIPLLPVLIWKYKVLPKWMITLIIMFLCIGFAQIVLGHNTAGLFFKTYTGVVITLIFCFYIVKYYHYNVEDIFKVYVLGCVLTCSVFMFQIFSYKVGFRYGYDLSYLGIRHIVDVNDGYLPGGFASEPSGLSILGPAILVSMYNIIMRKQYLIKRWQSVLVLLVGIMSFSSTVYFALLVGIVILALSLRGIMVFIVTMAICVASSFILYTTVKKFRERVDDSIELFVRRSVSYENIDQLNGSAVVLYHHYVIATENLKDHPVFGSGIGSHTLAHDRYSPFDESMEWYLLNKADANSLFLRLMSETGLFGLGLFFYFMFHFRLRRSRVKHIEYWLINQSMLVVIFISLLRGGNYIGSFLPLFLLLYYYSYKAEYGEETDPAQVANLATA